MDELHSNDLSLKEKLFLHEKYEQLSDELKKLFLRSVNRALVTSTLDAKIIFTQQREKYLADKQS